VNKGNTCAIVVSYFPDEDFPQRMRLFEEQFSCVVIVDNTDKNEAVLDNALFSHTNKIVVVRNGKNLGIARALNQGVEVARKAGYQAVVTFDQDSIIKPRLADQLERIYRETGTENVVIGCNFWHVHKRRAFFECPQVDQIYFEQKVLITSGMFIPLVVFNTVGGFREDFFIDAVDYAFCLCARKLGCSVLITCEPLIEHHIGNVHQNVPFWFKWMFPKKIIIIHSPVRNYYFFRNMVILIKEYIFTEPVWCLGQTFHLMKKVLVLLLLEEGKTANIKAFSWGLWHGLSGKTGQARLMP
jgi:rhamnosyltransferase